jgi:hypothetical protein
MENNLQNFLKKYSLISNNFIDDFFNVYDSKTSEDEIIINFNSVIKWLKMRKDVLKRTLIRTYRENIDYIIVNEKTKGRPKELITITPNCFKRLCMLSKTEKAESVRTYFIELEKLIEKYKGIIIENLNNRIQVLENNQKPILEPKKGIIYVIKSSLETENIFKLGKAKKFKKRVGSHNSPNKDNMKIILIFETQDIDNVEKCIKLALKSKQYRKKKEIYKIDLDLLKVIIQDCDKLILKGKSNTLDEISNEKDGYFLCIDK